MRFACSIPGHAIPAERHMWLAAEGCDVYVCNACPHLASKPEGLIQVLRVNCRGQTIFRVLQIDSTSAMLPTFCTVATGPNSSVRSFQHRSKALDKGRLHIVPILQIRVLRATTATENFAALSRNLPKKFHDTVMLAFIHDRAQIAPVRHTECQRVRPFCEPCNKFIVDGREDKQAARR